MFTALLMMLSQQDELKPAYLFIDINAPANTYTLLLDDEPVESKKFIVIFGNTKCNLKVNYQKGDKTVSEEVDFEVNSGDFTRIEIDLGWR